MYSLFASKLDQGGWQMYSLWDWSLKVVGKCNAVLFKVVPLFLQSRYIYFLFVTQSHTIEPRTSFLSMSRRSSPILSGGLTMQTAYGTTGRRTDRGCYGRRWRKWRRKPEMW